jgi:hypothetical protein
MMMCNASRTMVVDVIVTQAQAGHWHGDNDNVVILKIQESGGGKGSPAREPFSSFGNVIESDLFVEGRRFKPRWG